MKNRKITLILILSIVLLIVFNVLSFYVTQENIKTTVQGSVANQTLETAKAIATEFDTDTYKKFLSNPEKNEYYWKLNNQLNTIRSEIGALFVYTLMIDNPKISKTMIIGLPEVEQQYLEIGFPCTVPEGLVRRAFYEGESYKTDIIVDSQTGKYLSVGTPILDDSNTIIGFLGIDIGTDQISSINNSVQDNNKIFFLINSIFLMIVITSYYYLQKWYRREVAKEVENTEDTYHSEIQTLLSSVSSLRHDFSNHVQVVHGLLTIGETEKAKQYVNSLSNEIQLIESFNSSVEHPGLAILLKSKKIAAQSLQISMKTKVTQNTYQGIRTTDMIKILSNLIDNAIDATKELPEQSRRIAISCDADETHYKFEVTNSGPKVVNNGEIFKRGFSTKQAECGKVRGQGLFIVKEVVGKYNGEISIHSTDDKLTTATVIIPIK